MVVIVDKESDINTINKGISLLKKGDTLEIHEGLYLEKVKIALSNISIKGIGNVMISNNDYALKIHKDGLEYNTFRTYSLELIGENINVSNIKVINSSGDGKLYGQAVALSVIGNNINFNNCMFDAYQDTVFVGPLPLDLIDRYANFLEKDELVYPKDHKVYFNNSIISGDVDFIFGAGSGHFTNCTIHSKSRAGFVCAPATEANDDEGFLFDKCKFTGEIVSNTYLARPWRDYGKVTFKDCLYQNHIIDEGFDKWNDSSRDKTARFYEMNSKYIDNHIFKRVDWINK